jgi:hypothetical protein
MSKRGSEGCERYARVSARGFDDGVTRVNLSPRQSAFLSMYGAISILECWQ